MSLLTIIFILIISFLAGIEGIVDEFQFHQPLVVCTLIGIVTGNIENCIILGGTLQMIVLGWANIGAAVSPDTALASIASSIILISGGKDIKNINTAIALSIPLSIAGLFFSILVRSFSVYIIHSMDKAILNINFKKIEILHIFCLFLQGMRILIPTLFLLFIPTNIIKNFLYLIPTWLTDGITIGGGMIVAVGYAMVINMIANKEVWPFFIIGFVLSTISQLTLIGIGLLGISITLIYLNVLENKTENIEKYKKNNKNEDEMLDKFLSK